MGQFMSRFKWIADGQYSLKRPFPLLAKIHNLVQRRKLDSMKEILGFVRLADALERQNVSCNYFLIFLE